MPHRDVRSAVLRVAGVATVLTALCVAGPAAAAPAPGAPGLGDPFFPFGGNGGYDVGHYGLTLGYDPATRILDGRAEITATAQQDLSRFDLDLRGFDVGAVKVDGRAAAAARDGQELVITPARPIAQGATFLVDVAYRGQPQVITDPDGSIEGWVPTDDGAFVVGEPQGAPGWYPVNDNPRDKATYDFAVTVPDGLTVMANGVLVSNASSAGKTTWVWREADPMASYLATATLGRFDLTTSKVGAIPSYVAVDPQLAKGQVLEKLPSIVEY